MLVFRNAGELDIRAITLLGASVKEQDDAIGYFGTGLKFAIATILRHEGSITIFNGLDKYELSARPVTMRGEPFFVIFLNDKELSYTTQLGRDWSPWMAYRELYCNAKDEGDWAVELVEAMKPQEGYVSIFVEGLDEVHDEKDKYFYDGPALYRGSTADALPGYSGDQKVVFYRGVRVADVKSLGKPLQYSWNIKRNIQLTEDRTLRYPHHLREAILQAVCDSDDTEFMRDILKTDSVYFEYNIDWHEMSFRASKDSPLCDLIERMVESGEWVNPEAVRAWTRLTGRSKHNYLEPDDYMTACMHKALNFLEAMGYNISQEIRIVEGLGACVYGTIDGELIILSKDCFGRGTKFLAGTILEEHVHIKYGFPDHSRELQNWLLDELMTAGEKATGQIL